MEQYVGTPLIFPDKKFLRRWLPSVCICILSLLLTVVSWLLLGIRYGIGYCLITDWQCAAKNLVGRVVHVNWIRKRLSRDG